MNNKKKILVCPLDWGLGHATRCVPIIRELIANNAEVLIAADNAPLAFLKSEFPNLEFIQFPGYEIQYPNGRGMLFKMLLSIPKILGKIKEEHRVLNDIITNYKIDAVIADNRYGLWSKKVKTVFITHQVRIQSPLFEGLLFKINKYFINKFNHCWIPDYAGQDNLAGKLSHGYGFPLNSSYIGPLSRFETKELTDQLTFEYDVLVIVSGPEPQRSIFEKMVLSQLKNSKLRAAVVLGKPGINEAYTIGDSMVFSHLETNQLAEIIKLSKVIISRPGYSTIMDMAVFGMKCIFVLTPGQTEQEYLADYFSSKGKAISVIQSNFNLQTLFEKTNDIKPITTAYDKDLLHLTIKKFLSGL